MVSNQHTTVRVREADADVLHAMKQPGERSIADVVQRLLAEHEQRHNQREDRREVTVA